MIEVGFYQLAARRAEDVVPTLAAKAVQAGHRILLRAPAERLAALDDALWRPADSFLPHGIDSDVGPARAVGQPVLLSADGLPPANGADCLMQVGGDLPDDLVGWARILFLFDADGVEAARGRWRLLAKAPEVQPVYWREGDGGRFEKAA